jgi:hypothetical protein
MIKVPVTYKNFDGEEVTETLHFHLSMRQLTQMEMSAEGGMHDRVQMMLNSGKGSDILAIFEDIVKRSYGEREDNNPNSFLQSEALSEKFINSMAYDAFFASLMGDGSAMIEFISGLLPENFMNLPEVQEAMAAARAGETIELPAADTGAKLLTDKELMDITFLDHPKDKEGNVLPWAYREPTNAELQRMNRMQLLEVTQRKSRGWVPRDQ